MSFYKSNDVRVIKAIDNFIVDRGIVHSEARIFADKFGGEPVITRSFNSIRFEGLKFDPPASSDIWTVAQAKNNYVQAPRKKVKKEFRDDAGDLYATYFAYFPKNEASADPIYESMGTNWASVYISGLGFFTRDGFVYVDTSLKLAAHMVEILGSEYEMAKALGAN